MDEIYVIAPGRDLHEASRLAARAHEALRTLLPFLPARDAHYFLPKLAWVAERGRLFGLRGDGGMEAYLGGFGIPDFRNAGPAAYTPEWCHAARGEAYARYAALYRAQAEYWLSRGARIHALSSYAAGAGALEAWSLLGFGRIVMDAAAPVGEPLAFPAGRGEASAGEAEGVGVRRAVPGDETSLARLNLALSEHIGKPPVSMPLTAGVDAEAWGSWLVGDGNAAFVAERSGGSSAIAYIKASAPSFDVSDAVRGPGTLAISGLFVEPTARGAGVARALLSAMARYAETACKRILSVDCETTNPEAFRFWSRSFSPVSWSLERRL